MSNYKHGPRTRHEATKISVPVKSSFIQCVIGTAPVNLAQNPYDTVNKPFLLQEKADAVKKIGYSTDFINYTLCQSVYAAFDVFGTAPIVVINVLDPKKHVTAELSKELDVESGKIVIDETGILLDQISVKASGTETEYNPDEDYVASFNDDGTVTVAIVASGAAKDEKKLKVTYAKIDPSKVTYEDIIGSYDMETKKRTGSELINKIYPKFGVVTPLILAPGWTQHPAVNLALDAKSQLISGLFSAKVISDIDTEQAGNPEDVKEFKEKNAYTDRNTAVAMWPKVMVGDYKYFGSAQIGAQIQYLTGENDGIPSMTPSNKDLKITGICDHEGKEIDLDMDEANDYLNACGVVTAININGWKTWGNNTAAYPSSTDPIDRWICNVLLLDYIENTFKLTFFEEVDDLSSYRLIDNVVSGFNIQLNGLQGTNDIAGGEIIFDHDENPITEILNGHIKFHTRLGFYSPAEDLEGVFEFDPTITQEAIEGGAE